MKNFFRQIFLACILILSSAVYLVADEFELPNPPHRFTTHPSGDKYPAVSPDGRWVAYSSMRNGNWDIYLKSTAGGTPVQLTNELTDEHSPCWSPKGDKIAFVSYKEDAMGDIWTMNISFYGAPKIRKSKKVTEFLGYDGEPVFTPDGKGVVFTSSRSGNYELWYKPLKKGEAVRITRSGGFSPDISHDGRLIFIRVSDMTPSGEVFMLQNYLTSEESSQVTFSNQINVSPVFSPDGKTIALTRINRDTDNDGVITTDDNGSLMIVPLDTVNSIYHVTFRITSGTHSDHTPSWGTDGVIYYASSIESAVDIFSVSAESQLGREESPYKQLESALNYRSNRENFQLGLEAVIGFYSDSYQSAEAIYLKGTIFADSKDYQSAANYFKRVMRDYSHYSELYTMAAISNLRVITRYETGSLGEVAEISNPSGFIVGIDKILNEAPHGEPHARGSMLKANVLTRMGVYSEALEIYSGIIENYPEYPNMCAEARLRSADIFAKYGDLSEVVEAYLVVMEDYPLEEEWNRLAIDRIFKLESADADISGMQSIIGKYREYTALTASARLNLARKLWEMKETDIALSEYELLRQVESDNPLIETLKADAVFEASEIYLQKNDFVSAADLLKNFADNNERFRTQTLEKLKRVYIKRGNRVKSGDYQLAQASFNQARTIDPSDLNAHRGYIESMVLMDRANEVYREYREKSNASPSDPVLLYSAGLALSYLSEADPVAIRKSSELIELALDMDYDMIPAYLTLSYNYQAIEELQRSGKINIGFFKRIYRGTAEIISDFWRSVTFKSEPVEFSGYEKAINVLVQAIVLNDEREDPQLEAKLLLNLGNNYYALGEFGFRNAFDVYQEMLRLDSTLISGTTESVLCEKIGRAALFIDEFPEGRKNLKRSENAYRGMGDDKSVFRLLLLQAELEHRAGDRESSNDFFNLALNQAEVADIEIPAELFFTDIAFNWYKVNDWNEAQSACEKALAEFGNAEIPKPRTQSYKVEFELLGIELPFGIPIPVGDFALGASRSADGLAPADIKSLSLALLSIAKYEQGEYTESAAILAQKLKLAEFKEYDDESSVCTNNLGYLAYQNRDYVNAARNFLQSAKKSSKLLSRQGYYVNIYNLMIIRDYLDGNIELKKEVDKNVDEAIDFITTELTEPDKFIFYIPEKVNILGSAGERNYLEGLTLIASEEPDSILTGYSRILEALNFWQMALKLIGNRSLDERKIMLEANIAAATCVFGSTEESVGKIDSLFYICDSNNYRKLKWKLYYLQGMIQESAGDIDKAVLSFDKAVEELENLVPERGRQSPVIERQIRDLYQRLIIRKVESGNQVAAFDLGERLSGLKLNNALAQRDFATRSERQKFVWSAGGGSVNYFRREIDRLSTELVKPNLNDKKRSFLEESLRDIYSDYEMTLSEVRQQDPEFASLFSVSPVSVADLSMMLRENEAIIKFFELERGYKFWLITKDDFNVGNISINPDSLDSIIEGSSTDSITQEKWKILSGEITQPLEDELDFYSNLLIAPDGKLERLAFENLIWKDGRLGKSHSITYGHSAAYFYYARSKRIYTGNNLLVSGIYNDIMPELDEYIVTRADSLDTDGFFNSLRRNDYAFVSADFNLDRFAGINGTFSSHSDSTQMVKNYELFSKDASLALLILHGVDVNSVGWRLLARGLCFAGVGGIITIPREIEGEILTNYLTVLLDVLLYSSPLGAHQAALEVFRGGYFHFKNQLPVYWGDCGMEPDEAAAFARENFTRTVRLGNLNLRDENYEWAGRYYRQALEMAKGLNDRKSQFNLRKLLLQTAIGLADWKDAVNTQKELLIFDLDDYQLAEAKAALADYLVKTNDIDQADDEIHQSVELFSSVGDDESAAQALLNFAYSLEISGRYCNAVSYVDEARKIQVQMGVPDTVGSDIYRGKLLLTAGNPAEARKTLEPLSAPGTLSPESEYYVCQFLGRSYEKLMDYNQALEFFKRAFQLAGESSSKMKANSIQGMADVYFKLGNYEQSLEQLLIARNMYIGSGEVQELYLSFNTEGLLNHNMGRLSAAEKALLHALELVKESNDRLSESNVRQNLIRHYIETGQYQLALSQTRSKLELDKTAAGEFEQVMDYLVLSGIQTKLEDKPTAETALENARLVNSKLQLPGIEIRILVLDLYNALDRGDLNLASELSTELNDKAASAGIPTYQWRSDFLSGIYLEKSGDTGSALQKYTSAIEIIENTLQFRVDWLDRTVVLDDFLEPYQRLVRLLIDQGDFTGALQIAERARLLDLRNQIFSKGVRLRIGFQYAENVRRLAAEITALKEKMLSEGMKNGFQRLTDLRQQLDKTKENYFNIVSQVSGSDIKYYEIYTCNPSDIIALTRKIKDNEALLYYFRTEDELIGWFISTDTLFARNLPVKYDDLTNKIIAFRNLTEGILNNTESAKELYSYLFAPFEKELFEKTSICILPDASLSELNFDALMDESGKYVIDKWSISETFNLGFLFADAADFRPGELEIILISQPDYAGMPKLEFVDKEIESISFTFPGSRILNSPELNTEEVINSLESSEIIHFACHGVSESDALLDYALLIGKDSVGSRLTTRDIFGIKTDAFLIYLSACGKNSAALKHIEPMNINTALSMSGAENVIYSMWKADDLISGVIAKRFYRHLKNGYNLDEALRQVKLYIKSEINPHPGYWSAFQLYGNSGKIGVFQ